MNLPFDVIFDLFINSLHKLSSRRDKVGFKMVFIGVDFQIVLEKILLMQTLFICSVSSLTLIVNLGSWGGTVDGKENSFLRTYVLNYEV